MPRPFPPAKSVGGPERCATLPSSGPSAGELNLRFYEALPAGQEDYWRFMAAPRCRIRTILRLLGEVRARSVVDLGCGNGQLLRALKDGSPATELVGVDLSAARIERNREEQPDVEWHCLNLEEPIPAASELLGRFDAVVASELIEHLEQPEAFLVQARRLASPRTGYLVLTTQSGPLRETERRVGHQAHFSCDAMRGLLREAGWQPVKVWNAGFPFHDLSKWLANLRPDSTMERFGERPYGPVEKLLCFGLRVAFRLNSRRRGAQLFALARRSD